MDLKEVLAVTARAQLGAGPREASLGTALSVGNKTQVWPRGTARSCPWSGGDGEEGGVGPRLPRTLRREPSAAVDERPRADPRREVQRSLHLPHP